jgi:hypothetical protein
VHVALSRATASPVTGVTLLPCPVDQSPQVRISAASGAGDWGVVRGDISSAPGVDNWLTMEVISCVSAGWVISPRGCRVRAHAR